MKKKLLIYIGIPVLIIVIIAGLLTGPVYSAYFSQKTMRGLKTGSIDLGGKTKEEITALITTIKEDNQNAKIKWNENIADINICDSGIVLNIEKTIENVMKAGKTDFVDSVVSWYTGKTLNLSLMFQKNSLKLMLLQF